MATIHREFDIGASPDAAWAKLRQVGEINRLIDFLGEVTVDGDRRSCALGDQGSLEELIVTVDDGRKRLVYAIQKSPFELDFHSASMQVVEGEGAGGRFLWTTDVKPDAAAGPLADAIDHAVESFQQNLSA